VAARPRSGQRRAGKKEGVLGVLCPQGFLPARRNFWRVPARRKPELRAKRGARAKQIVYGGAC